MSQLATFQSTDPTVNLMQTNWKAQLNPLLTIAFIQGVQLTSIAIGVGVNHITTHLGKQQQGWLITDINASAQIYRSAPFNSTTLTLTSSAKCVVNLWIY